MLPSIALRDALSGRLGYAACTTLEHGRQRSLIIQNPVQDEEKRCFVSRRSDHQALEDGAKHPTRKLTKAAVTCAGGVLLPPGHAAVELHLLEKQILSKRGHEIQTVRPLKTPEYTRNNKATPRKDATYSAKVKCSDKEEGSGFQIIARR